MNDLISRQAGRMRYKGKYVAQIVIDFDIEKSERMLPFEEIKKKTVGGELTDDIRDVIREEIIDDYGTITVTQQYADMYEVERQEG
jgi:hypothetical protein